MASDDRRPPLSPDDAAAEAARIDDGLIHEWLDGQCDQATAARVEALVHAVPAFAERVAEARGFTAAASRILGALDDVPSNVLPTRPARDRGDATVTPITRRRGPSRTLTQWSAIAAVLAVAATGVWIARPNAAPVAEMAGTAALEAPAAEVASADAAPAASRVTEAALPEGVSSLGAAPTTVSLEALLDTTAATRALVESARAPRPSRTMAAAAIASAATAAATPASPAAPPTEAARSADAATAGVATAEATARKSLAAETRGEAEAPRTPSAAPMVAGAARLSARASAAAPSPARAGVAAGLDAAPDSELAYAVHRVACAPTCAQRTTEVLRSGVVRRADGTSGRVDSLALTRLAQLADSLRLAELPPTLRLEGRLCRSVGSLRESLRVRFRVNEALRQVMGLPWCTDGSHPLDVFAAAVEALGTP